MPKIPLYQPSVNPITPSVPAPAAPARPPEAAFGTEVNQANANLAGQISKAGDVLANHVITLQQKADDAQVLDTATKFQQDLQDRLTSDKPGPNGVPTGYLTRNGAQAIGATVQFDQDAAKIKKQYMGQVLGPDQQRALDRALSAHLLNAREQVIHHEAQQRDVDFKTKFNANQESQINGAAALTDPTSVSRAVMAAQTTAQLGYTHLGITDKSTIDFQNKDLAGKIVTSAVAGNLEQNPKAAEAILLAHKGQIPDDQYAKLQTAVDGKKIFDTQVDTWNKLKGVTLSDGMADLDKMHSAVYAMNLPTEQKDKVWDFVKSNAHTQDGELTKQRASTDRDFMNQVIDLKQKGGTLADALKLAPHFGYDLEDAHTKEDAVKKLYEGKNESDPVKYVTLWDKVQAGESTNKDLVDAMGRGDISTGDFKELWKERARQAIEGNSPAQKLANERIKLLGTQTFGSNKEKAAEFEYTVQAMTRGKSPEEKWKFAQDYLKNDPSSGWIFQDKQYVTNMKILDAQNTAWGQVKTDITPSATNEIVKGMLLTGKQTVNINDMAEFANQFGGMQNLKPDQPAGRAMASLIRRGIPVTAKNMKVLLDKHPDGNY